MIPYRFQRSSVERFIPFFNLVKANHPHNILVSPEPLSLDTFCCRFRDAVKAIHTLGYHDDLTHLVRGWADDYSLVEHNGHISIGSKKVNKDLKSLNKPIVGTVIDANIGSFSEVEKPSTQILKAILLLYNNFIINDICLTNTDPLTIEELFQSMETSRELVLHEQDNKIYLL